MEETRQKPSGTDQALSYCRINGREFSEGEGADPEAILTGGQTSVETMILCNPILYKSFLTRARQPGP